MQRLSALVFVLAFVLTPLSHSRPQGPTVTSVDLYGLRGIEASVVREAVGVEAGEPLSESVQAIEDRVAALEGVAEAHVAPIQYTGHFALFVGIREAGSATGSFREAPTGDATLDAELLDTYDALMDHLLPAIRSGQGSEDHDQGHSLSHYPPMREIQLGFIATADEQFDQLRKVLRTASDTKSRAVAATILAYATDKVRVAPELQFAATDPGSLVRNNAVRALGILAGYANDHPELGIEVDPTPFLQLIESLVWTDRNKGAAALDSLSKTRDPELFAALTERSLDELAEMARWRSQGHSGFSMRILIRLAGIEEEEVQETVQAAGSDYELRLDVIDELLKRIEG